MLTERPLFFNIVFHNSCRVLRMISDQITANVFLKHIFLFCFLLNIHGLFIFLFPSSNPDVKGLNTFSR